MNVLFSRQYTITAWELRTDELQIEFYFKYTSLAGVWRMYWYLRRLRRQWHPTPVLLPGKPHGWKRLEGCSPWGCKESDTTEWLHFHFSLSCIGEGNGNPLQCSCLENPRDRGAWWAAVYRVTQSQTRLKWLSSSSSSWIPGSATFRLLVIEHFSHIQNITSTS